MLIAFDTETHVITPENPVPHLVCVSFADEKGNVGLLDAITGAKFFEQCLRRGDAIIGHNIAFDCAVLIKARPECSDAVWAAYDEHRILDTMVREKLINIAKNELVFRPVEENEDEPGDETFERVHYTLAALAQRYLGWELNKSEDGWRMRYAELDGTPIAEWPAEAVEYSKRDAESTLQVFLRQALAGIETPDFETQCQHAWALQLMRVQGMTCDIQDVSRLELLLSRVREESRGRLFQTGIYYNTRKRTIKLAKNTKYVKERVIAVYANLGMRAPLTKPDKDGKGGGAVSISRETLEKSGDPELMELAQLSKIDKQLDTYLPMLRQGGEDPIRARFNVLVSSGRTSCSGPNLQNLPRGFSKADRQRWGIPDFVGVRECFSAPRGKVWISADYSQLELCTLAQSNLFLFGDSAMADAINAGRDLHLDFAAQMLKVSYDDAVRRKGEPDFKNGRQFGKVFNFGKPGGLGADKLVEFADKTYGVKMTKIQAQRYGEVWLKRWPEMVKYFKHVGDKVRSGPTTFRQFVSRRLRGGCGYTDGCNTYFQGLAADGAKWALYQVTRECFLDRNSPLFGSRPVCFIHDEIILESPDAAAHNAAMRLCEVMKTAMEVYVPDVLIRVEPAMMRKWYKDAEPVWENGRLVPWTPERVTAQKALTAPSVEIAA